MVRGFNVRPEPADSAEYFHVHSGVIIRILVDAWIQIQAFHEDDHVHNFYYSVLLGMVNRHGNV